MPAPARQGTMAVRNREERRTPGKRSGLPRKEKSPPRARGEKATGLFMPDLPGVDSRLAGRRDRPAAATMQFPNRKPTVSHPVFPDEHHLTRREGNFKGADGRGPVRSG